jgi:hypothetical protein
MMEKIQLLQSTMALSLPSFYIDFLIKENLLQSKLFSPLTLLYGIEDLHTQNQSKEMHHYLPKYICIGNNSGDYGFFINIHNDNDPYIYVCGLGDLDESSLEKIANSFELWAEKNYDSDDFLETLYQNQFTNPLKQMRADLHQLSLQERQLSAEKDIGAIDLKTYLQKKRTLKPTIEAAEASLVALQARQKNYKSPPVSIPNLEQRHQFKFPLLYRKLHNDGMLDWGVFGKDWASNVLPMLIKSPPLLLFAKDFELLPVSDIDDSVDRISGFNPDCKQRFIPIGVSGAGDMYAFHLDTKHGSDMPVVYLWHDDNRCDYRAKNLQDFIFLQMLGAVLEIEEEYDLITNGDLHTNLDQWLRTHKKYLADNQVMVLEKIFSRDVQTFVHIDKKGVASNYTGLISSEEYDAILEKEIDFPLLNTSFDPTVDM